MYIYIYTHSMYNYTNIRTYVVATRIRKSGINQNWNQWNAGWKQPLSFLDTASGEVSQICFMTWVLVCLLRPQLKTLAGLSCFKTSAFSCLCCHPCVFPRSSMTQERSLLPRTSLGKGTPSTNAATSSEGSAMSPMKSRPHCEQAVSDFPLEGI